MCVSFISTVVTACGQTLSSPLTYSLCHLYSLAISAQCGVHIGLYTLSSRRGFYIGCHIVKGVSERCVARLLLTSLGWIDKNSFAEVCKLFCNYANSNKATNINSKTVSFAVSIVIHTITSICYSEIIY